MDTDSLYISIETDDVYVNLKTKFKNIFDFSDYPLDHYLHNSNSGSLGFLKSETIEPIHQFLGLRAKMYAFSFGDKLKTTAKGLKKSVRKSFTFFYFF